MLIAGRRTKDAHLALRTIHIIAGRSKLALEMEEADLHLQADERGQPLASRDKPKGQTSLRSSHFTEQVRRRAAHIAKRSKALTTHIQGVAGIWRACGDEFDAGHRVDTPAGVGVVALRGRESACPMVALRSPDTESRLATLQNVESRSHVNAV